MFEKLPEAAINPDEPWVDDKLDCRQVAQHLTRILGTVSHPLVASVSAPFGMGKTFFAKRWVADLKKQGNVAIYLNAWESDFSESPLVAFMHTLRTELTRHVTEKAKKDALTKKFMAIAKVAAPALAKTATRAAVRAGAFVLVGDKVDDLVEAATKGAVDEVEKLAKAQIDAFATEQESRSKFRAELDRLRTEVTEGNIYIVVDELDRCRPPYTLEFLEAIKHLFDVPGFVFVLVVDEEQILASAAALYGVKTEGEDYLRKFIDYRFRLPLPSYRACAQFLYKAFSIGDVLRSDEDNFIYGRTGLCDGFSYAASRLRISLRAQIQSFSMINLVLRAYGPTYMPVLAALACIREGRPQLWTKFVSKTASYNELASVLDFDPDATDESDDDLSYIHQLLRIFFVEDPLPRLAQGWVDELSDVDEKAARLAMHLKLHHSRDRRRFEMVDALVKKIELVEQFSV